MLLREGVKIRGACPRGPHSRLRPTLFFPQKALALSSPFGFRVSVAAMAAPAAW